MFLILNDTYQILMNFLSKSNFGYDLNAYIEIIQEINFITFLELNLADRSGFTSR